MKTNTTDLDLQIFSAAQWFATRPAPRVSAKTTDAQIEATALRILSDAQASGAADYIDGLEEYLRDARAFARSLLK